MGFDAMSDIKAVILCAGEGTRLRPLTFSRPKHLLPVAGKPLVGRALDTIKEAGIQRVGLVVGHHPEEVQRYVGGGAAWEIEAEYITQQHPLGLAHAVNCARDFVGDSPFIVFLGDNLLEVGIKAFVEDFTRRQPDAALLLREVDDPRRYGVAELDSDGAVKRLVEKPAQPRSNLAIVGVYAFHASIFEAIAGIQPSQRGEYEITDAIQWLIDQGRRVSSAILEGFWEDAGEPVALLRANRLYLDRLEPEYSGSLDTPSQVLGALHLGQGSRIHHSHITGPCFIGENCVVENATIGPYVSLGDGCQVTNSAIEDAVIQAGSRIRNLPGGLKRSVLGEQVVVAGDGRGNSPLSLILGDMAQIRLM